MIINVFYTELTYFKNLNILLRDASKHYLMNNYNVIERKNSKFQACPSTSLTQIQSTSLLLAQRVLGQML